MKTIPIKTPDQPITYFGIAYVLNQEDNQRFQHIESILRKRLGNSIYIAPPLYRHITITGITRVSEERNDKALLDFYHQHERAILDLLERISLATKVFTVNFTQLEVHERTIILKAEASKPMADLRSALYALPSLDAHTIQPNFVHTSFARYRQQLETEYISQVTDDINFTIPLTLDRISLIHASSSFSKPQEVIAEYQLA